MAPADSLRIWFAAPAYWPATAFGGPIGKLRSLAGGLAGRGHEVHVLTTSLSAVDAGRSARSRHAELDGVHVHYAATPVRYRWMGVTPTLPLLLRNLPQPDVVHVFGYRDVVSTVVAARCAAGGIPYAFEPLGMFRARLRKVALKRLLDATVFSFVPRRARAVVVASERERDDVVAAGVAAGRVHVRPNGFPPVVDTAERGALRRRLGLGESPLALYVGRIAAGKGIELLLAAARELPDLHVVLAGPDDGHGTATLVAQAARAEPTAGRVHWLGVHETPAELYPDADVLVLASSGESFGNAAAEAAAAGRPIVVSDRCGIAELLGPREAALVVPYEERAVVDAIRRVLADATLAGRLGARGAEVARELSWPQVVERQEEIYRRVLGR